MRTRAEILEAALASTAKDFPNSVVADLMMYFPQKFVLKLITMFSGQRVWFPKVETIWKSYRNKIIKEALDAKNTKVVREQLAVFFGISSKRVSDVYHEMKRKEKKPKPKVYTKTIRKTARRIYAMEQAELLKEFKDVLLKKR